MKTLSVFASLLLLPALALADSRLDSTIETLRELERGQRGCRVLHASWTEEDGFGGSLAVAIHEGKVTVSESRIGLPDLERTGSVDQATCQKLARLALEGELWKLSKKQDRNPLAPALRMGVTNGSAFKARISLDQAPKAMLALRETMKQLAGDIAKK